MIRGDALFGCGHDRCSRHQHRFQHLIQLAGGSADRDAGPRWRHDGRAANRHRRSRRQHQIVPGHHSQSNADAFASIAQSSVQAAGQFYAQLAATEGQQAAEDRQAKEAALLNPPAQTNYTPPTQLDPVVYYDDGSSLDTTSNIMTLSNGSQVDITTGLPYIDPKSIIEMANGAYLDTTNNILHEADGTQVDATTGLKVSTSA